MPTTEEHPNLERRLTNQELGQEYKQLFFQMEFIKL
jgi:hypothetical protein